MTEKSIHHFGFYRLTDSFWNSPNNQKEPLFTRLAGKFAKTSACTYFYQVAPMTSKVDFMVWNAALVRDPKDEAEFFSGLAQTINSERVLLEPVADLWGYTRPSMYSKAPSAQEIDPFSGQRKTYLVLYPFVKTVQWYLLGKDTRQGMMNEHIRIGHQYPEITQLLLYSFGVQDQEFIVVYEMEDLFKFSELVQELRGSDARGYTERDTPLYSAIWRTPEALGSLVRGMP